MLRSVHSLIMLIFLVSSASGAVKKDASSHRIGHVLLLSIDGMHAVNLANYIQSHPQSAMARLSEHGVTYTNASTTSPSDSIPGFLAQITGATPRTSGVWYEVSYRRDLSPPQSHCETLGTRVFIDDEIDTDPSKLDGGGINRELLPKDPLHGCAPVYPHELLRVNTVFEVLHDHHLRTAWVDKHLAYEIVQGPSGKGVDDLYTPEIAATNPEDGRDWAGTLNDVMKYDGFKVEAVLHEIDGLDHSGKTNVGVPAIFGMNFQALHNAQKHASDPDYGKGGYLDAETTPGKGICAALDAIDAKIGSMLDELTANHLLESTLIIVSAKHGDSPMDVSKRRIADMTHPAQIIGPSLAYDQSDDGSVIWLKNPADADTVVDILANPETQRLLGIQEIFAGNLLKLTFGDPSKDPRVPDIILKTETGLMFHKVTNPKLSENGGINEDDLHVPLLISNPALARDYIVLPVQTTQIAPTILKALGYSPEELQAVQLEHTQVLPALTLP